MPSSSLNGAFRLRHSAFLVLLGRNRGQSPSMSPTGLSRYTIPVGFILVGLPLFCGDYRPGQEWYESRPSIFLLRLFSTLWLFYCCYMLFTAAVAGPITVSQRQIIIGKPIERREAHLKVKVGNSKRA